MDGAHSESLRKAYDSDAPRRDDMEPDPWRFGLVEVLADRLKSSGGRTVADLGCGTGQLAAHLVSLGLAVSAIDLSPENVARTRARKVDAQVGDLTATPFATASFDGALAFNSFLHVAKARVGDAFAEARRILRPGGVAMIVVWGGRESEGPMDEDWLEPPRFFSLFTDDDFVALPTDGFRRLETRLLHEHRTSDRGGLHPQMMLLQAQ